MQVDVIGDTTALLLADGPGRALRPPELVRFLASHLSINTHRLISCLRLRWEEEKPSWFTEAWKARIPPDLLEGIHNAPIRRRSSFMPNNDPVKAKLRAALRDAPPWCLDADALAAWLETNWVQQEEGAPDNAPREQKRRRNLARQLEGTSGFELLTACTSEASEVPFAKITHTKSGDKLKDTARAQQLTTFLHARAGLAFHYQLFCVASDRASPLFDYEYVQLVRREPRRARRVDSQRRSGPLAPARAQDRGPLDQHEMALHARASASEHVATVHHHGSSSAQAYFGITEHCTTNLRSRIIAGEGVRDDDFWRWSTQLARGLVDIHERGIIHLAIKPETIRLTDDTHDVRISGFQNACEATRAAAHVLRPTDKPEYRAPDQVYSFASDVFSVGVTLFEMATTRA